MERKSRLWLVTLVIIGAMLVAFNAGSPTSRGASSSVKEETACPTPGPDIPQDFMLDGRTVRLDFFDPNPDDASLFQLEAGRLCVGAGVVIPDLMLDCPADPEPCEYDGPDNDYVHYLTASIIYVESGTLSYKQKGTDGKVIHYRNEDGYPSTPEAPGLDVTLLPGESVFIENAYVKIWNSDASNPAIIYVTGFKEVGDPPGCGGQNCWIPS